MFNSLVPTDAIFNRNGSLKTTSLKISEAFNKQHKDILRKIESLDCSAEFASAHFYADVQKVSIGNGASRESKVYEMTKDGFMFLVMGFTGAKAAAIKEAYINAFNQMAETLQNTTKTNSYDRTCLRDAINMLVAKKSLLYSDAYSLIHQRFSVSHIDQLTQAQLPQAVEYVHRMALEGDWLAPAALPEPSITQQFSFDELYQLAMLWHRAEVMRKSIEQVYPLLRVAEHRLAGKYYEMYRLFKLDIDKSQRLLAREVAQVQLPHDYEFMGSLFGLLQS